MREVLRGPFLPVSYTHLDVYKRQRQPYTKVQIEAVKA